MRTSCNCDGECRDSGQIRPGANRGAAAGQQPRRDSFSDNGGRHFGALGRLVHPGADPMPMTSTEFGKFIVAETEKWGKVIRAANIKAE